LTPILKHLYTLIMKKIASIVAIAAFAVGFTSCKKDHTCTCKGKISIFSDNDTTLVYDYGKTKKSDAKETCDAQQATFKILDNAATCEL
jgi:hypothetical protein